MIWTPLVLNTLVIVVLVVLSAVALVQWRAGSREATAVTAYPACGQIIDVDGAKIHMKIMGQGADIVLLHGANGSIRDFTFGLADRLAKTNRVIALDRPGLGWSSRPEGLGSPWSTRFEPPRLQARLLQQAADAAGAENPVVVGHSFGGAIALAWAIERPDDTAGLVLLAGVANPWPGKLGLMYRVNSTLFGSVVAIPMISAFVPRSVIDEAVTEIFKPQSPPDGYLAHFGPEMTLRRSALRANAQQVNNLKPYIREMVAHYSNLKMPVEILHGDADNTVPLDIHARPLCKQLPNANLTVLQGVGHMPHHAEPGTVIDAVARVQARASLRESH